MGGPDLVKTEPTSAHGLFLTFEGLDGSGKSTHLERAAQWLRARGREVLETKEPGGTELGVALRRLLLDPDLDSCDPRAESLLMFADRRQHLVERVEPALAGGTDVLSDRFTDSSIAYQGVGRGLGVDFVLELDRLATGGRRPDRTFLFDLPPEVARARGARAGRNDGRGPDRLDAESLAFYTRVRDGFLELARREPERFRVIASGDEVDTTWARVERHLEDLARETFGGDSA